MSKTALALLFLALSGMAFAELARAEEPKTVCSITVNSPDERDAFRKYLPPGKYNFVELLDRKHDEWMGKACERRVQCDVLVISGHFNAGETFYSDKVDVEASLKMDELERASCSGSCPSLFAHLKEVYLFGCESLNPDPSRYASAYGESGRERMRRIFSNVPVIYGFSSAAPVGPTASMLLGRYFSAGGASEVGSGHTSERLLRVFGRNHMVAIRGARDSDPGTSERRQICEFFDDRESAAAKLHSIHTMIRSDPELGRKYLARIESLLGSLTEAQRDAPDFRHRLAEMGTDDETRDRFLALARASHPFGVRARMVQLAARIGWLQPQAEHDELAALVGDMLGSVTHRRLRRGGPACTLNDDGALAGELTRVSSRGRRARRGRCGGARLPSAGATRRARKRAPRRSRAPTTRTSCSHRPICSTIRWRIPPRSRALAAEVTRKPPSEAKLRAQGSLDRLHNADRGILDELGPAYAQAKTVKVQRANAEDFIRSDPDALRGAGLAAVLRGSRLKSSRRPARPHRHAAASSLGYGEVSTPQDAVACRRFSLTIRARTTTGKTTREGHAMQAVGVGRRAVAVIIDGILLFVVFYVLALATGNTNVEGFRMTGAPALGSFLIGFGYFIVMEATQGATIGKIAGGPPEVGEEQDGSAMDWGASIIRNLLRIIDGFAFYLVGAIVVWVTKSKQRLGDLAAHTLVVRSSAAVAPA